MADTASQLTLPEALEIAKQKQHGDVDSTVAAFLRPKMDEVMRRLQAQPSTYVFTKDEFAVVNYYRDTFGDNEITQQAIMRFWKQYPAEPREEISKSAFSEDSVSLTSDPTQPQNGSQKPLSYLNWKVADQSRSEALTEAPRLRKSRLGLFVNACDTCSIRKIKCDRRLPLCRYCMVNGAPCSYVDRTGDYRQKFRKKGLSTYVDVESLSVYAEDKRDENAK